MKLSETISTWFRQRSRVDLFDPFVREKKVPLDGRSIRHYLGGTILFFFVVQLLTGVLLSLHYIPTMDQAFKSVERITYSIEFGWLVRSVHHWSAQLMVIFLFLHICSVFWSRAYQKPRELTWLSGCLLLALSLMICFFGYLLPWNDLSFFATCAGIQIVEQIPLIGKNLVKIVQGGPAFGTGTLSRFYAFHTILLPALIAVLLAVHVYLVLLHGMRTPLSWVKYPGRPQRQLAFFPDFLQRELLLWVVLANLLVLLCVLFPVEIGEEADHFIATPVNIKPEWYFLFLYKTLKIMPSQLWIISGETLVVVLTGVGTLLIGFVPFIDRGETTGIRYKAVKVFGVCVFLYFVAMTIWGHLDQPILSEQ